MSPLVAMPMAPPLESYPRLPYRGEDARAVLRSCPCACGERVDQLEGDLVEDAVRRHNSSSAHSAWRSAVERLFTTPGRGGEPTSRGTAEHEWPGWRIGA